MKLDSFLKIVIFFLLIILFYLSFNISCSKKPDVSQEVDPTISEITISETDSFSETLSEGEGSIDSNISACNSGIIITLGGSTGEYIEPLLGVNAGPYLFLDAKCNVNDYTTRYQQVGVTMVRTHDFYGPLDMSVMYPDKTKDPKNRNSYNFQQSDVAWKSIIDGGFEPYFRIGDSWNNVEPPGSVLERENYANAIVEIIRHYREGQWDGFTTSFQYVEIWNEPDNQQFWPSPYTPIEFFEFFVKISKLLKKEFPDLKIGGPAVTQAGAMSPNGQNWTRSFLQYLNDDQTQIDFFSWHIYSNDPSEWEYVANFFREELDRAGYQNIPMHVTEWNTDIRLIDSHSPEAYALRTGSKGASILTSAWITMQENKIANSFFYRGTDPSLDFVTFYGMFYADGKPKKIALAFQLWSMFAKYNQKLEVFLPINCNLRVLAGKNDTQSHSIIIVNSTESATCYSITGIESEQYNLLEVNDDNDEIQSSKIDIRNGVNINAYTIHLLISI